MIQFDPNTMEGVYLNNNAHEQGAKRYAIINIWNDETGYYYHNDLVVPSDNIKAAISSQALQNIKNILQDIEALYSIRKQQYNVELVMIEGEFYMVRCSMYGELKEITPLTNIDKTRLLITRKNWGTLRRSAFCYRNVYNTARKMVMLTNNGNSGYSKLFYRVKKYKPYKIKQVNTISEEQKQTILDNIDEYYALFADDDTFIGLFPRENADVERDILTPEQIGNINACLAKQYGYSCGEPKIRVDAEDMGEKLKQALEGVTLC